MAIKSLSNGGSGASYHRLRLPQTWARPERQGNEQRGQSASPTPYQDAAVESFANRPSTILRPWESALRHRSEHGVVLEMAVPELAVQVMEQLWGPQFGTMPSSGATVDLGQVYAPQGPPANTDMLRSMLLSGPPRAVRHCAMTFSRTAGQFSQAYRTNDTQSYDACRTSEIPPWKYVFRSRSVDRLVVEQSLPEAQCDQMFELMSLEELKRRMKVEAELGDSLEWQEARSAPPTVSLQVRPLTLSGLPAQVVRASAAVISLKNRVEQEMLEKCGDKPTHWMKIRVPNVANAVALMLRKDAATMHAIARRSQCQIMRPKSRSKAGVFRIEGTKSAINLARVSFETMFTEACAEAGVSRGTIDVVDSGELQKPITAVDSHAKHSAPGDPSSTASSHLTARQVWMPDPANGTLSDYVRATLRTLTHPVVLLTACTNPNTSQDGNMSDDLSTCRGVTVSSFNTVTLHPKPIVSFNLKIPSRSWDAIRQSQKVRIHILSATPDGASVAHAFTRSYERPHEPFKLLKQLGAGIDLPGDGSSAPRLTYRNAVLAEFMACLQAGREAQVGDHVVVFAEIMTVRVPDVAEGDVVAAIDGKVGLAYGLRGYRGQASEINVPELPALEREAEETVEAPSRHATIETTENTELPAPTPHVSAEASNAEESDENDLFERFETYDEPEAAAEQDLSAKQADKHPARSVVEPDPELEPDEVEKIFQTAIAEAKLENREEGKSVFASSRSHAQPAAKQQMVSYGQMSPSAPFPGGQRSTARHSSPFAWGLEPGKQTYSTLTRRGTRHFATCSDRRAAETIEGQSNTAHAATDPRLLKVTVEDFLGTYNYGFLKEFYISSVTGPKKMAKEAFLRLQEGLQDGTLTEQESAQLESTVAFNERRVTKAVARRAAYDLRRMLDRGYWDAARVGWLEASIEKGQVALLDEAKQVRQSLEDGKFDRETYMRLKTEMQSQYEHLATEVHRLRQLVDDQDEDDLAAAPDAELHEKEAGDFDDFSGNV